MRCPNDSATLIMSDRHGVEIDYCPDCRGVWLDRGELDKIVERSDAVSGTPSRRPSEENRNYDKKHGYDHDDRFTHRKKKDSFLGDLFDF